MIMPGTRARGSVLRAATALFAPSMLVIWVVTAATPPQAEAVAAGSRIPWQGSSWYLHGANVPWVNWACDFGCGSSGGGVSSSSVQSQVAPVFAQVQAANMHVIRWWVFEGDPWQINRDASGAPTSVNPA